MDLYKDVLKVIVSSLVLFFLILGFSPGLLDIDPPYVVMNPCPPFDNALKPNNELDGVTKMFENEVEGPESIAVYKNVLYSGLADGRIVRFQGDKVQVVAQIGNPDCEGRWDEDICGRPLGMRFDKNGILYVADAYYGLFQVNVETGAVTTLYSSKTPIDSKQSFVVNDLDISISGVVYFSDSAQRTLKEGIIELLDASPNGRVLKYDPQTKQTEVLFDGIAFANGIQLSPNEDFLLVCESSYNRIMKYFLKGEKQGKLEVFADNLPGLPDNLRLTSRGTYWVAQCSTRLPDHPGFLDRLGDKPLIRKVAARFIHLLHSTIGFVSAYIYGPPFMKELHYKVAHMYKYATFATPEYGLILELGDKGQIIRSFHSPAGAVRFVSEVLEYDNSLYLGSPWHKFLGKVKL